MSRPGLFLFRLILVSASFGAVSCKRPGTAGAAKDAAPAVSDSVSDSAAEGASVTSAPASADLFGANLTVVDKQGRTLECRGIAKSGERVLVQRNADKQQFVVELARLSDDSRAALAAYPDTRVDELEAFVDARDYAAAKRAVKVEMISASWCGWCTKAKEYFAKEKIAYQVFDHESQGGKSRQAEWGSTGLPTVKIGEKVVRGYGEELYRETLLAEYRKTLAPAGGS